MKGKAKRDIHHLLSYCQLKGTMGTNSVTHYLTTFDICVFPYMLPQVDLQHMKLLCAVFKGEEVRNNSVRSNLKIKAGRSGGSCLHDFPSKCMRVASFRGAPIEHGFWS